jgi:hypothetical protein
MGETINDWLALLEDMERNPPYAHGLWRLKKFLPRRPPPRRRTLFRLGYRWEYYLTHPHSWVSDLDREIRRFIHRGLYGYTDIDVWNLNTYLLEWLPEALRTLAKEGHGCAQQLFDESRSGDECHKWEAMLVEMAEGFEFYRQYEESHWEQPVEKQQELYEEAHKQVAKSLLLMAQWFPHLWD